MKRYPEKYEKSDFVFFLHIPKTAGTSVTNALQAAFPKDHTLTPYQVNNVRKHPREIYLHAELLYGHFTHDVYGKRLPRQPNFIFTFLRDPVQHYVSLYFHLKLDPTFTYTTRLTEEKSFAEDIHAFARDNSIEDFLRSPNSHLFDNFQTRYLVRGLSSDFVGNSDTQLLPIAQRLLLDLPCFGLTERFDESLVLLESVMGLAGNLRLHRDNKSRNRPENFALTADTMAEIQSRTAADSALYAVASSAFDARLAACQPPAA